MKSSWPDHRRFIVCGALLLITLALYSPVLTYDFIDVDDPTYVVRNLHINKGFHWNQIPWFFQARYALNWHPLTWLSHCLDCQLYGLWAGGHHLTNVILHALSAMALFLIMERYTKAFWRSAFVSALFAWHPMHVESVAWISERKDCLCCLFWMLTLWAYLRYAEESEIKNARRGMLYALSILCFAMAMLAKPMAVTLPFVLLLLDFWPLARFRSRLVWPLVKEKIPFFLLSAVGSAMTVIAQNRGGAMASLHNVPMASRFWNAAISYVWYIQKTLWPKSLVVFYPLAEPTRRMIAPAIALLLLISLLAVLCRRMRPFFLFGWCWYLGTLVPVIGLLQVGSQATADRYSYIPSIGLFIIIAWGVNDLAAHWPYRRMILGILASAVAIACLAATRMQLAYWKDSETLFAHALKVVPDFSMIWGWHIDNLRSQGRLEEARRECERALRMAPRDPVVENFLGEVLLSEEKYDQAADHFRICLQSIPKQTSAHVNLGRILLATQKPEEAVVEFQSALDLDPANEKIHADVAKTLAILGKVDDAKREFAESIRLMPDDADPHFGLAALLARRGKTAEAIAQYRQAIRLQPDFTDALNNLAWILATDPHAELRDGKEAVLLAIRACVLTQNKAPLMIGTLAAAYAEAGRFDEAVAAAQKAHDLAVSLGKKGVAAKNLELLEIYRSHQPYHEK